MGELGESQRIVPPEACSQVNQAGCGSHFQVFKAEIDTIADFLLRLKTEVGVPIPVILRPFHENSGDWFWWGVEGASPTPVYRASLRAIWNWMFHDFLSKGIPQRLWAVSPNGRSTQWGNGLPREQYLS